MASSAGDARSVLSVFQSKSGKRTASTARSSADDEDAGSEPVVKDAEYWKKRRAELGKLERKCLNGRPEQKAAWANIRSLPGWGYQKAQLLHQLEDH